MRHLIDPTRPFRHSLVPVAPSRRVRRLGLLGFIAFVGMLIWSARYLMNRVRVPSFEVRILHVR